MIKKIRKQATRRNRRLFWFAYLVLWSLVLSLLSFYMARYYGVESTLSSTLTAFTPALFTALAIFVASNSFIKAGLKNNSLQKELKEIQDKLCDTHNGIMFGVPKQNVLQTILKVEEYKLFNNTYNEVNTSAKENLGRELNASRLRMACIILSLQGGRLSGILKFALNRHKELSAIDSATLYETADIIKESADSAFKMLPRIEELEEVAYIAGSRMKMILGLLLFSIVYSLTVLPLSKSQVLPEVVYELITTTYAFSLIISVMMIVWLVHDLSRA